MEEIKRKKRVALYIRVSTEEQVDMFGIDLQRTALMGLIASKGNEYVFAGEEYVYIDEGESGTKEITERPAFARLIEDMTFSAEKPFDIVAVYKIDRFARRLKILLEILELFGKESNKVEFISAHESIDTSTPFGRAMLGIIGVIAELELETIKERTKAGRLASASKGGFMGTPPLGYVKNDEDEGRVKIQEEEAKIVRQIFELFVYDRMGEDRICEYLTMHKVKSPKTYIFEHHKKKEGKKPSTSEIYKWYPSTVKEILQNEIYIGYQYYDKSVSGVDIPKKDWKMVEHKSPLFDKSPESLFYQAQNILQRSGNKYTLQKADNRRYLLQGLLKCANCFNPELHQEPFSWHGTPHKVRSTGQMAYYYECSSKHVTKKRLRSVDCKTISLPAPSVEKKVLDLLFKLINNPKVVFKYQQKLQSQQFNIKHLQEKLDIAIDLINSYEPLKKRILDSHASGYYTNEERDLKMAKLNEDNKRYKKERADIEKELSVFTTEAEYIQVFEVFKEKYKTMLKSYKNKSATSTPEELYRLIHMMVHEVIIFSRPKLDTDSVSGPKKEGQMIPYMFKIALKIPSDMLYDMLSTLSPEEKLQAEKGKW